MSVWVLGGLGVLLFVVVVALLQLAIHHSKSGDVEDGVQMPLAFSSQEALASFQDALRTELQSEGFAARADNIRFVKDRRVLTLTPGPGTSLVWNAPEEELPFLEMVLDEAAAKVPVCRTEFKALQQMVEVKIEQHIANYGLYALLPFKPAFRLEALKPRVFGATKSAVIDELLDALEDADLLTDRYSAAQAVIAREGLGSTGFRNGIALPYGRTDAVQNVVVAVGVSHEGIKDYATPDRQPVHIVVLILAPAKTPAPLLQLRAAFAQRLNTEGRAAVLACDTAEDMAAVFLDAAAALQVSAEVPVIKQKCVSVNLQAGTADEAVDILLGLAARSGAVTDAEEARRAIQRARKISPGGLEHGVALPHCRTEAVSRLTAAVGICREGLDFNSADGTPSTIIVLVLIPPSVTTQYTRFLGRLLHALDDQGRAAVLAAQTNDQVFAVLTGATPAAGK